MLFSKPCHFVLFSAYLLTANADTIRAVQQHELEQQATETVNLGTANNYSILTKAGITNVPPSSITGSIAVSPIAATAMTGFGLTSADDGKASTSSQFRDMAYAANYIAPTPAHLTTAVGDMEIAYTDAAGRLNSNATRTNIGTGEIGGLVLSQSTDNNGDFNGVYTFTSDVTINADVTFQGAPEDIFIIQMTGNLLVAANVNVFLTGDESSGAKATAKNIFWQVAGSVIVGAGAHMEGIILAKTSVLFETGSSLNGRVLAQTACALQMVNITEPTN